MQKPFLVTISLALAAYLLMPMTGLSSSLNSRIGTARQKVAGAKAHEGILTTQLSHYSARIQVLRGDIGELQQREDRVQVSLNAKQVELTRIAARHNAVASRLTILRGKLVAGRKLLAERLVALYKDDQPDMVTVVLEAHGFTDLLDRADFIQRISDQNETIVTKVRSLSHEVGMAEKRLRGLEVQATNARNEILAKRNEIAGAKQTLVSRQADLLAARNVRASALAKVRATRQHLEGHLGDLEAQQARIQARLQNASSGISAGPIKRGSGQFIWPVNGPITSGFGGRNIGAGSEFHPGIDIGAATGTPIRAAGAGTVTLMQPESASGGYGNFTCISHTSSISTCYGHQSRFGTSSGAHVSQGQVIGYVGCTGRCFGSHLHFEVRVNGAVVNPLGYL